jgi:hypothetical protein
VIVPDPDCEGEADEVFNTSVENSVEKHESIFVSDSARDGSALCTGARAGLFVLQPLARTSLPSRCPTPS